MEEAPMHTAPGGVCVLTADDLRRMREQRPPPAAAADRCLRCDNPIEYHVFGPVNGMVLVTEYDHASGQSLTHPEWADRGTPRDLGAHVPLTDHCLACLFKSERDAARAIRHSVAGAGPRDDAWYIQCLPEYKLVERHGERGRGFSALVFGRRVGRVVTDRHPDAINTRRVPWPGHYWRDRENVVVIQAWLRRVRYRDTPFYIQGRWLPGWAREELTLRGLSDTDTLDEARAALGGLGLLQAMNQGGRPSEQEEIEAYFRRRVAEALAEGFTGTRVQWADRIGIHLDTLYGWQRTWPGVLPPPSRRRAP